MAAEPGRTFETEDDGTFHVERDGDRLICRHGGRTVEFEVDEVEAVPLDEDVPPWCDALVKKVGLEGIRRVVR